VDIVINKKDTYKEIEKIQDERRGDMWERRSIAVKKKT
jgi:hypothetical protein